MREDADPGGVTVITVQTTGTLSLQPELQSQDRAVPATGGSLQVRLPAACDGVSSVDTAAYRECGRCPCPREPQNEGDRYTQRAHVTDGTNIA